MSPRRAFGAEQVELGDTRITAIPCRCVKATFQVGDRARVVFVFLRGGVTQDTRAEQATQPASLQHLADRRNRGLVEQTTIIRRLLSQCAYGTDLGRAVRDGPNRTTAQHELEITLAVCRHSRAGPVVVATAPAEKNDFAGCNHGNPGSASNARSTTDEGGRSDWPAPRASAERSSGYRTRPLPRPISRFWQQPLLPRAERSAETCTGR